MRIKQQEILPLMGSVVQRRYSEQSRNVRSRENLRMRIKQQEILPLYGFCSAETVL